MDRMDMSRDVITRLKFIGKIQPGEKINTKSYLSVMENTWLTSFLRKFYTFDNRVDTFNFISDTVSNALYIIEKYKDSDNFNDQIICENLTNDLKNAVNGLNNLTKTYQIDVIFICQIESIIENITLCLKRLEHTVPKKIKETIV